METFVGDSIKLMLDTNQDLSGYSNLFIKYIRPDGTTGNWASSECPTNNNVMERTYAKKSSTVVMMVSVFCNEIMALSAH